MQSGFNRYMVECECEWGIECKRAFLRFNRYMVECEYHLGEEVFQVL